ncbi:MAG TPA: adenylate/guanylate cyclase domain-containing protein [Pleomorphomonadaceae bacterium]|nr:adenylate/guanylate cyclase domain-containing protein [Pleomorphomonadaceae bacterium]
MAVATSLLRLMALAAVGEDNPVLWGVSVGFATIMAANLAFVARTRRFTVYVYVLLIFAAVAGVIGSLALGGLVASSASIVWGMLLPIAALLFLGPRRAIPVFALYSAMLLTVVVLDPLVANRAEPPPYPIRLALHGFNLFGVGLIVFLLLRSMDLRRRAAQARSEELLTNAIPAGIATRLRRGEQRIADVYPETTVLFADLVGFTPWAERTDADQVVDVLDRLFSRFDELAVASGVEKVKTIGDAYMAVAGGPDPRSDHADAALGLARAMLGAAGEVLAARQVPLELRIGLASGSVVAGVIGQRRLLFDLWGDTVNTASRMESAGVPGRVQVAPSTWEILRDRYRFEPREGVEVKGKGRMTTYLLVE